MSSVQEIETAITKLNATDLHAVADWLEKYRDETWDQEIERDVNAGKLDQLINEAKANYRAGKATPFP